MSDSSDDMEFYSGLLDDEDYECDNCEEMEERLTSAIKILEEMAGALEDVVSGGFGKGIGPALDNYRKWKDGMNV